MSPTPVIDLGLHGISLDEALVLSPYAHCTPMRGEVRVYATKGCLVSGKMSWTWDIRQDGIVDGCRIRIGDISKHFPFPGARHCSKGDTLTIWASLPQIIGGESFGG
jgi:hypothetical protein